jgi:hypothetical protein
MVVVGEDGDFFKLKDRKDQNRHKMAQPSSRQKSAM